MKYLARQLRVNWDCSFVMLLKFCSNIEIGDVTLLSMRQPSTKMTVESKASSGPTTVFNNEPTPRAVKGP